jgi:hypothetical protein
MDKDVTSGGGCECLLSLVDRAGGGNSIGQEMTNVLPIICGRCGRGSGYTSNGLDGSLYWCQCRCCSWCGCGCGCDSSCRNRRGRCLISSLLSNIIQCSLLCICEFCIFLRNKVILLVDCIPDVTLVGTWLLLSLLDPCSRPLPPSLP